jgi:uncharacterized protein (TIGR04255 family)
MNELQHVPKLPNAPLQEVVFEARWEPDTNEQGGLPYDSEFAMALGKFHDRVKQQFPSHRLLVPKPVPVQFLTGQIAHQFWSAGDKFPLVQFGPCIVTVNEDGAEYEWEKGYKSLIRWTLERLFESYEGKAKLSGVKLFYIDAIDMPDSDNVLTYLNNLKVALQFDLHSHEDLASVKVDFGYRLDHDSMLQLSVQNGTNNQTGGPALVWHTAVHRSNCEEWNESDNVVDAVMEWCVYARSVTSSLFRKMTQGPLYDSFQEKDQGEDL